MSEPNASVESDDELDWDVDRDGRMRDHASPFDTVSTELFTPPGSEL